jgi:2-polyprenyl-6-hydroxyphenyl methylase/3-demethylubiquinone-9 3-methyltransferase
MRTTTESTHAAEVASGQRFEFGKNWAKFLRSVDEERIELARESLRDMLDVSTLDGKTFCDAGSGSGLFSLAARQLGATVHSFDYDPQSVACTRELKRRYFDVDVLWTIEEGSALDASYISSLGQFDVVYSWGVLHHTGDMWRGVDLISRLVRPGGVFFLMLYLDHGRRSHGWRTVKKTYCSGIFGRYAVLATCIPYFVMRTAVDDLIRLRNPFAQYRAKPKDRGMSIWRDWIDWLGGYPFEFAKPREVEAFCNERGFTLRKQVGPEYVFDR